MTGDSNTPKVGDEIWFPGGKRKVLAIKRDWASASIVHKKIGGYWLKEWGMDI